MYGDGSSGGSGIFQSTFLVGDGFGVFRGEFSGENLNDSSFIIFIYHCKGNYVEESRF